MQAAVVANTTNNRIYAPGETEQNHPLMDYDAAGNQKKDHYSDSVNGRNHDHIYDAENHIKSSTTTFTSPAGTLFSSYSYDADGRRVRRTSGGAETWQVYGLGGELLAEYAANIAAASPQKEYGYRNGQLLITAKPETQTYVSQSFVLSKALGAQRADSPGWAGLKLTVAAQSVTVSSLGRQCSSGNSLTHELRLIRVSDNATVGSTNVAMNGCAVGQFKYASLAGPVTLAANTAYLLVSYEVGGDLFHDWTGTVLTTMSVATVNHGVYTTNGGATWGPAGSTGNSYVPLDFQYQTPPSQSLVTGKTLGSQRGDSPGWAGLKLTVGAQPLTVSSLGRQCQAGNSLTHELKLIRANDNATVASVNVSMSGCTAGQFKYGTLAGPVTLAGNTAYLLVSYEVGSDNFHDWTGTVLTTTSAATVNHGVYTTNGGQTWGPAGGTGNSYVPLDLQYQTGSIATATINWLVADQLGTPRMVFDQTGALGSVKRHDYLPFGEELVAGQGLRTSGVNGLGYNADAIRQKFSSKERDNETGLDYFLARYYSSTQGRLTSPDEFARGPQEVSLLGRRDSEKQALAYADIFSPQSLNKYHYCLNNPLRYIDPDGHDYRIVEEKDNDGKLVRRYVWDSNYTYKKGDKNGAPPDARYIDTQGRAIQLWGSNSKDPRKEQTHGYQVVTAESTSEDVGVERLTDGRGAPPTSYANVADTEKVLLQAGYKNLNIDPFHSGTQFFKETGPTLHISVSGKQAIVQDNRSGLTTYRARYAVDRVEFHADRFSQVKELGAHMKEATKQFFGVQ